MASSAITLNTHVLPVPDLACAIKSTATIDRLKANYHTVVVVVVFFNRGCRAVTRAFTGGCTTKKTGPLILFVDDFFY